MKTVAQKLKLDEQNQETALKQQELVNRKKTECYDKLSSSREKNFKFNFPFDTWQLKLAQATTLNQVLEVERYINIANDAYKALLANDKDERTTNELMDVQKFLNTPFSPHKLIVYYDSKNEEAFSPQTKFMRPTEDYEYIDISKYKYDSRINPIPNEVLLNGVNLSNVIKRFGLSSEKGQFLASLAYKLGSAAASIGKTVGFEIIKFGGQLVIAAVPSLVGQVAAHPILASSVLGG